MKKNNNLIKLHIIFFCHVFSISLLSLDGRPTYEGRVWGGYWVDKGFGKICIASAEVYHLLTVIPSVKFCIPSASSRLICMCIGGAQ